MTPLAYEKPALLTQVDLRKSAVIEASAGTGKTYTLEHLVIDLLLTGGPERKGLALSQVLVVTFTEKATGELRARVSKLLRELLALRPGDEKALENKGNDWVSAKGRVVEAARVWLLDDDARTRLAAALSAFDAAPISTIHGFCQRVLAENAFESGRPLAQELVDGREAFNHAARDALRRHWTVDADLRPWFEAWIRAGNTVEGLVEPMFRAHAIRGERFPKLDPDALRNAAARCAQLRPQALADAAKAAKAHHATVKAMLGKLERVVAVARTVGSLQVSEFAAFLLDPEGNGGGVAKFREALQGLVDPAEKSAAHLTAVADDLSALLAALVDPLAATVDALLPSLQSVLATRKQDAGQFDFDDLLRLLRDRLASPDGAAIAEALRDRFRVALVDEFQDTDEVQWDVFHRVFHAAGLPLFVIGDPKQAIYGFRGADVATYLVARETIVNDGGDLHPLVDCYRSTPAVIGAVNTLLDDDASAKILTGRIRYDRPVNAGRPDLALLDSQGDALKPLVVWDLQQTVNADGARRALAKAIADECVALLHPETGPTFTEEGKTRALRPRDLLVLVRKAGDATHLVDALRARGLPVSRRDGGLFESPQAADLLVLLRAVLDPGHPGLRGRALLTPWFGLTLEEVAALTDEQAERLAAPLVDWHDLARRNDLRELCTSLLSSSRVVARELLDGAGERGLTNLQHLVELLLEEAGRGTTSLADLTTRLATWIAGTAKPAGDDDTLARLESERDAVRLLSMHAAKGLESTVVFWAAGFGSDRPPDAVRRFHLPDDRVATWIGPVTDPALKARLADAAAEEERRLTYVALTRAKGRLYVPHVAQVPNDKAGPKPATSTAAILDGLNARLDDLLATPSFAAHADVRPLAPDPRPRRRARPGVTPLTHEVADRLASWSPPPALLRPQVPDTAFAALSRDHAARVVTSYSALARRAQRHAESTAGPAELEVRRETFAEAPLVDALTLTPTAADLPGGTGTGQYLHELIEELDFADVRTRTVEQLLEDRKVLDLLGNLSRRHGLDPRFHATALAVVHAALTHPLAIGKTPARLAHVPRETRELEFLYPLPEADRPWLQAALGTPFEVRRGWVKGFVDFVFEHDGKWWFADWKSDRQPSYDAASLASHVRGHYGIQARLYLLALARLVGATDARTWSERVGGMAYVYLRGLSSNDPTAGVATWSPTWDELLDWERDLAAQGLDVARAWAA